MDEIVIHGGRRLSGRVQVSGAKNAALPLLFSTLLASGRHCVSNVPRLRDIDTVARLLRVLGAEVRHEEDRFCVTVPETLATVAPYDLVRTMRASVLVLGPLLVRCGRARVSLPGGCAIGARPIDQHLKGLSAMGADIRIEHGYVEAVVERLRGARIVFDMPTVGGTEHLMMAAALADGTTVLENAAREPEIVDLALALNSMGARVHDAGSDRITIEGVPALRPLEYAVMPDRIEAGTFMLAAAITGGDVTVLGAVPEHQDALTAKLRQAEVQVEEVPGGLRVTAPKRPRAVDIQTRPFPGFATDMQAQFMALMCLADGPSVISEQVFENRFMHVCELQRMGADIRIDGHTATVRGVAGLSGAPVMATDLRASASLVLAGLAADNTTVVSRVYHLDRGYERIEEKLRALGAAIERRGGAGV